MKTDFHWEGVETMKDLLILIAKALVDDPDGVSVTETVDGSNVTLELSVAEGDMGKVIGRHGRIAKAIRSVVKSAATRENKRVNVEIV